MTPHQSTCVALFFLQASRSFHSAGAYAHLSSTPTLALPWSHRPLPTDDVKEEQKS